MRASLLIRILAFFLVAFRGCEENNNNNAFDNLPDISGYPIVGTNQTKYFSEAAIIEAPLEGESFYGQNAFYPGNIPNYLDNGDGTVTDMVTGLMWQQSCDINGDGVVNADDKMSQPGAAAGATDFDLAGHTDWRLPNIYVRLVRSI